MAQCQAGQLIPGSNTSRYLMTSVSSDTTEQVKWIWSMHSNALQIFKNALSVSNLHEESSIPQNQPKYQNSFRYLLLKLFGRCRPPFAHKTIILWQFSCPGHMTWWNLHTELVALGWSSLVNGHWKLFTIHPQKSSDRLSRIMFIDNKMCMTKEPIGFMNWHSRKQSTEALRKAYIFSQT